MATTLNIQRFTRYVRQGRTPAPVSCTAMAACTQQAYNALLDATWRRVEEKEAGLPRHNWAQTGFSDRWDAAKYCGDYADGYQHGYATAVCYTIKMPADALAGTVAKIVSLAIPAHGDRWLDDGCDIKVKLSASATPPEWDATPDDTQTGLLEVVPSNTGTDTSATVAFDWSAAPKTSLAYLHITLRLTNYLTHRGAWIEGGAMIDGLNIAVTFDRDVEPDADESCPVIAVSGMATRADGSLVAPAGWDQVFIGTAPPVEYSPESSLLQASEWSRSASMFPGASLTPAEPTTRGGEYPIGGYLVLGTDNAPRIVGSVRMFVLPQTDGRTMTTMSFDAPIPAPTSGTRARIAMYSLVMAAPQTFSILDTATIANPDFWNGKAASTSLGVVRSLGALTVTEAIAAPTWAVSITSAQPMALLMAISLCRVCGSPGWTQGRRYGLVWSPHIISMT